jgi:hypothetical protein
MDDTSVVHFADSVVHLLIVFCDNCFVLNNCQSNAITPQEMDALFAAGLGHPGYPLQLLTLPGESS